MLTLNVVTIIILITVVVSIAAFNNRNLMDRLVFNPYDIKHFGNRIRIFGHMFIHADWAHLGFNMFALYMFGTFLLFEFQTEFDWMNGNPSGMMGTLHFVVLYVLGGLFATLIPYIRHHDNPSYRSLGASGAVSAVVFAYIIWNPMHELGLMFIPVRIPAYIFGPLYLFAEFLLDRRGGSRIAHDAHIGGALFGILYALIINIDKGKDFIEAFTG